VIPTPDDNAFMDIALDQARRAGESGDVPVGAVLVRDNKVVASAGNRTARDRDPTAHAELLVVRDAAESLDDWRLGGCTLYVTLEPCAMCAGAIVLARLGRLVYGAADPKAGACGSVLDVIHEPRLNHRVDVTTGVLAEECGTLLRGFFVRKRAKTATPLAGESGD
jgi:tRNA(adenine34) deaminase